MGFALVSTFKFVGAAILHAIANAGMLFSYFVNQPQEQILVLL